MNTQAQQDFYKQENYKYLFQLVHSQKLRDITTKDFKSIEEVKRKSQRFTDGQARNLFSYIVDWKRTTTQ